MTIRNFKDAHKLLQDYVPSALSLRNNYSLERMRELMNALGNPQDNYKVVHVAGTSGKTSTSYFVAALLKQSGKNVGLSVSPHIDEVNERVQINLEPLPEDVFCSSLGEFIEILNKLSNKPTYFELLTAFAYWYYDKVNVDYVVMEVGLGGLLDATNVINNSEKVCVITDIGLDHTKVLGNTLAEIAYQKAGIILPNSTVFMHKQSSEVMRVLEQVAQEKHADLKIVQMHETDEQTKQLPHFQQRNWSLAYTVYEHIAQRDTLPDMQDAALHAALKVYIPARMEVVHVAGKLIIMDGAHNEQKMQALVASIQQKYSAQDIAVLISIVSDKSIKTAPILREIAKISQHIIVTSFKSQQDIKKVSTSLTTLERAGKAQQFKSLNAIADPREAFDAVMKRPEPIVLVTGSFYLLNKLRSHIFQMKSDDI